MRQEKKYRETIVFSSASLFREHGYKNITINDIAQHCSVQPSYIIYMFKDKQSIAIHFINKMQLYIELNILYIAYDKTISPCNRLLDLNKSLEEFFISDENWLSLINLFIESVDSVSNFKSPFRNFFQSIANAYREILETVYSDAKAQCQAEDFVAKLQGAFIMMRVTGSNRVFRRFSARLLQSLLALERTEPVRKLEP